MPGGFLAKTKAEVALDLVDRYLDFAGDEEREKYRDADSYLKLYERAYRLILDLSDHSRPSAGFQPE